MNDEIEYLILRTKKAISLLGEPRMRVEWGIEFYVKEFDLIREDIGFIAKSHIENAKNLMLDFLNMSHFIFARVKDKDCFLEDFFQKCVEDLVRIITKLPLNMHEIVDIISNIVCMQYDRRYAPYGHRFNNNAVSSFKDLLSKNDGFDILKRKLTELNNSKNKKKPDFLYRINKSLEKITYYTENGIATEYNGT